MGGANRLLRFVEESVPVGEQLVTLPRYLSQSLGGLLVKRPRLAPLGVVVRVAAEKGLVSAGLRGKPRRGVSEGRAGCGRAFEIVSYA